MNNTQFSQIPSVSRILEHQRVRELLKNYPKSILIKFIHERLESYRTESDLSKDIMLEETVSALEDYCLNVSNKGLTKVINATGIILHTNLGRSPLPKEAVEAIEKVASCYSNLEYDTESGKRGSRQKNISDLLSQLTGADAGFVVNNNAAAVFLVLNTLCSGKEVIVSRGEQVEIGGSFRIPEIISQSGAKMAEVGTTNKTHIHDYKNAISEETSCILKVHTSNYKIIGFTHQPSKEELINLSKDNDILLIEDQGSGNIIDLTQFGLDYEPTVSDSIKAGFDLVLFSGDKLLGGPQAGIIVGKKHLIDKIKENQLSRILRVDKMAIAAMESVLMLYLRNSHIENIPILSMISKNIKEIERDAQELAKLIKAAVGDNLDISLVETTSQVGGGTLPEANLPDRALYINSKKLSPNMLQEELRKCSPPIITRISEEKLLLCLRTVFKYDYNIIAEKFRELFGD